MRYSDEQRIKKILGYAEELMQYVKKHNVSRDIIKEDHDIQWAITTPLYNIGEQAYFLTQEFKNKNPQILWSNISGLRHRLVHDYDGTNWEMVAGIVFEDIPALIKQLKELVK